MRVLRQCFVFYFQLEPRYVLAIWNLATSKLATCYLMYLALLYHTISYTFELNHASVSSSGSSPVQPLHAHTYVSTWVRYKCSWPPSTSSRYHRSHKHWINSFTHLILQHLPFMGYLDRISLTHTPSFSLSPSHRGICIANVSHNMPVVYVGYILVPLTISSVNGSVVACLMTSVKKGLCFDAIIMYTNSFEMIYGVRGTLWWPPIMHIA